MDDVQRVFVRVRRIRRQLANVPLPVSKRHLLQQPDLGQEAREELSVARREPRPGSPRNLQTWCRLLRADSTVPGKRERHRAALLLR